MFWDTTYILVILGAVLCAAASWNISQTYRRYSAFSNARGLTAEAVAAMILRGAGIPDVRIERIGGSLTDHYSPGEKVLRLSDSVYGSRPLASRRMNAATRSSTRWGIFRSSCVRSPCPSPISDRSSTGR